MKFRSRVIVVDAEQFLPNIGQKPEDGRESNEVFMDMPVLFHPEGGEAYIVVATGEGLVDAFSGDWVLKDKRGNLKVVRNDIFRANFEPCPDKKKKK
jgi:hypothetical protein